MNLDRFDRMLEEGDFAASLAQAYAFADPKARYKLTNAFPEKFGLSLDDTFRHLETLDLAQALWWFIENVSDDLPERTDLYFYLCQRMQTSA